MIVLKKHLKDFEVVDYWELDLCAIGVKKNNKLVYISNFNFIEKKELKYDYDFEIVNPKTKEEINVIKEFRDKLEIELLSDIKLFFRTSKSK